MINWLFAIYIWAYIHRPFEVWPVLGQFNMERVLFICVFLAWLANGNYLPPRNRLTAALFTFFGTVLLSWLASPYMDAGEKTVENFFKVIIFSYLLSTSINTDQMLRFVVTTIIVSFFLYSAHSFREYLNGRFVYRMGIRRMIGVGESYSDPNAFSASLVYTLPLLYPIYRCCVTKWQTGLVIGCGLFSIACILLTGSRSSFLAILVLATLLFLGVVFVSGKNRIKSIAAIFLILLAVWIFLPENLSNRFYTIVDSSVGPANAKESADSRYEFLTKAYGLWQAHPITGLGPASFPIASGTDMQVHSLYGQLLAETGTIGIIGFLFFIFSFYGNYRLTRRITADNDESDGSFAKDLTFAISVSIALLLLMGVAGHNLFRFNWYWLAALQICATNILVEQAEFEEFDED